MFDKNSGLVNIWARYIRDGKVDIEICPDFLLDGVKELLAEWDKEKEELQKD